MKGTIMAGSSLDRTGESPPSVRKGHGTAELGPTDSTDSGSDVRGGPGFRNDERLDVTPRSPDAHEGDVEGAGPDVGDRDLDSDSDRGGTGERASSGRDDAVPVDQTLYDDRGGEDISDDSALNTTFQESEERETSPRRGRRTVDVERGDVEGTADQRRNEPV